LNKNPKHIASGLAHATYKYSDTTHWLFSPIRTLYS